MPGFHFQSENIMSSVTLTPCLAFDKEAEEAANFYTSVFKNSQVTKVVRWSKVAADITGHDINDAMVIVFELDGRKFTALNGLPHYTFNPAVSFQIECANQGEVDYYWEKLTEGGDETKQACGWLQDKFGLSWQIFPKELPQIMDDEDSERKERASAAMMKMKKIDIAALRRAADGQDV